MDSVFFFFCSLEMRFLFAFIFVLWFRSTYKPLEAFRFEKKNCFLHTIHIDCEPFLSAWHGFFGIQKTYRDFQIIAFMILFLRQPFACIRCAKVFLLKWTRIFLFHINCVSVQFLPWESNRERMKIRNSFQNESKWRMVAISRLTIIAQILWW